MLNLAKSPAEIEFETGSTPSTKFAELLVETLLSDSVDVLRVVDSDDAVVDAEPVVDAEAIVDAEAVTPRLNDVVAVVNCTTSARDISKMPT